ncbi:conserved hypothetical protein [Pediculus humanus corporis]|uniref:GRIP domain-containing protein n=1 Tax=Pediculus humanus subsp. corporis TaxID=121224 RepID=E0W1G5_PEDHC|nr:uncharacterized protein Phum_PHUM576830 [Pediculus humanus corporis]EEB19471.1 conserved hypothetical protein [Pediculus humanus corporis]
MQLTLQNVDLTATSPSNMTHGVSRSRRSSLSSVTSEPPLFPIYESGLNQNFLQSDMESEFEDGLSGQIEKISKEQLYQSFKKMLNRYNKYKGRYTDLLKHYKELQHENFKTKNVLQESQDKALRRMAELREQCQLEQKAKAHLEESLRNEIEDRDHKIGTLRTKISLLNNNGESNTQLIDLSNSSQDEGNYKSENLSAELTHLKNQNKELQTEIDRLKKIKETACHLVHRCDTTMNEATEDIKSDTLKLKMSELKSEIQKMKSENESLSHLLSRNIITEDDKKVQGSGDGDNSYNIESSQDDNNISGSNSSKSDDKDKKIEKLNNLLLKCKEKINELNSEIKAKNLIIENNNKTLKELKEEMEKIKGNESTEAEEKIIAARKEMDAKEEQIKTLTKELKTKENEYVKEKKEMAEKYENRINEITKDLMNQIKMKGDENKKLSDELKAKKIESEFFEKNKKTDMTSLFDMIKRKSLDFDELAKRKTSEIKVAQDKLEKRMTTVRNNLDQLFHNHQTVRETVKEIEFVQQKIPETETMRTNNDAAENFHLIEKLKSDVTNLTTKIDILESELKNEKSQSSINEEEMKRWKEKCSEMENERENVVKERKEKSCENEELKKELIDKNEKIKKYENEKENARKEKIETESKLKEYVDKYNKLDVENRKLQNDLMEKCGKLVKDLNETKEKVKNLEEEKKMRGKEWKKYLTQKTKLTEKIKEFKREWENVKTDAVTNREIFTDGMEKLKFVWEKSLKSIAAETEGMKAETLKKDDEIIRLKSELEEWKGKVENLEELDVVKKEKEINERLKNELEALRGNLKGELKEKEEKTILVDKLTQECNLLLAEIENLKKTHSNVEKKLETELQTSRQETSKEKEANEKLQEKIMEMLKVVEGKENDVKELIEKNDNLTVENENMREKLNERERTFEAEETTATATTTNDEEKIQNGLSEEKKIQELNEKVLKLTNEMNEAFGEIQMKNNELETLRNSLKSMKENFEEREKRHEEEKLRLATENENKLNVLKNEIKYINSKHEEDIGNYEENLNTEMKEANEKMVMAEKTSAEILEKLEKVTSERDELKAREEEKNLKMAELENCMMALKAELDDKFNEDENKAEVATEKHGEEVKSIIMRYDKEIEDRDVEIEALKKQLERMEVPEDVYNKHRDEIKKIIIQYDSEIAERDEEIETMKVKLLDHETTLEQLHSVVEELNATKNKLLENEKLLLLEKNSKREKKGKRSDDDDDDDDVDETNVAKGKNVDDGNFSLLEMLRHERNHQQNMINETNKNLLNSKPEIITEEILEEVELEPESKSLASSTLENSNNNHRNSDVSSIEVLQRQLIQQATEMKELKKQYKKEIFELKKLGAKKKSRKNSPDAHDWYYSSVGGGLENDTEYEYLRNILYEYMMGKEQMVLAKVLSAIVKFNDEQTHNVLEKEQQRQTLFGQLGLL